MRHCEGLKQFAGFLCSPEFQMKSVYRSFELRYMCVLFKFKSHSVFCNIWKVVEYKKGRKEESLLILSSLVSACFVMR